MIVVDFWHFLTIRTLVFINQIRSAYLLRLLEEIIEVLYLEEYFKHNQAMPNPLKMFFSQSVHNWIFLFYLDLRFKYDLISSVNACLGWNQKVRKLSLNLGRYSSHPTQHLGNRGKKVAGGRNVKAPLPCSSAGKKERSNG